MEKSVFTPFTPENACLVQHRLKHLVIGDAVGVCVVALKDILLAGCDIFINHLCILFQVEACSDRVGRAQYPTRLLITLLPP